MKDKPYRSLVGLLLWIARISRPDIQYQVGCLARAAHNPGKKHWDACKHMIRYMKHTHTHGIRYKRVPELNSVPGQFKPTLWPDATWAPNYGSFYDNYRSVTGWCCSVGSDNNPEAGNLISWGSHRQSVVALATAESEWHAATEAAKEALYVADLFEALKIPLHGNITLRCDNQATISQSVNAVDHKASRHIGMKAHFLRQQCNWGKLQLSYQETKTQRGDIFTKLLPEPDHVRMRECLGVVDISSVPFRSVQAPGPTGRPPAGQACGGFTGVPLSARRAFVGVH